MKKNKEDREEEKFQALIRQLRSVEIDEEELFVVEGDLLMTEQELRKVSEKRLEYFVACVQAASKQAASNQADDSSRQNIENPRQENLRD